MAKTQAPHLEKMFDADHRDPSAAAIDFVFKCQSIWMEALLADFYRFWLEPYFYASSKKRPPGYYYRIARIKPR